MKRILLVKVARNMCELCCVNRDVVIGPWSFGIRSTVVSAATQGPISVSVGGRCQSGAKAAQSTVQFGKFGYARRHCRCNSTATAAFARRRRWRAFAVIPISHIAFYHPTPHVFPLEPKPATAFTVLRCRR